MGIGGISVWQLLIILLIVMMLFGTKRLRGLGSDLGAAIKGFRSSVSTEEPAKDEEGDQGGEDNADGGDTDSDPLNKEQESKS